MIGLANYAALKARAAGPDDWRARIAGMGACSDGLRSLRPHASYVAWWAACDRADWMLWLLGKLSGPPENAGRRPLVRVAVACAEMALEHVRDERIKTATRRCLDVALAWADGRATMAELREARSAADAADAAAYAAAAAAYAAYAAYADAAYAAADAAAYAAYARSHALKGMSDIVRAHYPTPPALPKVRK